MPNTRKLFVVCFILTLSVITWGDLTKCKQLPWPPRFIATGLMFGILDMASGVLGEIAPMVGVGIVIAALLSDSFTSPDCNARLAASTVQPSEYQDVMQNAEVFAQPPQVTGGNAPGSFLT